MGGDLYVILQTKIIFFLFLNFIIYRGTGWKFSRISAVGDLSGRAAAFPVSTGDFHITSKPFSDRLASGTP